MIRTLPLLIACLLLVGTVPVRAEDTSTPVDAAIPAPDQWHGIPIPTDAEIEEIRDHLHFLGDRVDCLVEDWDIKSEWLECSLYVSESFPESAARMKWEIKREGSDQFYQFLPEAHWSGGPEAAPIAVVWTTKMMPRRTRKSELKAQLYVESVSFLVSPGQAGFDGLESRSTFFGYPAVTPEAVWSLLQQDNLKVSVPADKPFLFEKALPRKDSERIRALMQYWAAIEVGKIDVYGETPLS